jgi:hypothetical protein
MVASLYGDLANMTGYTPRLRLLAAPQFSLHDPEAWPLKTIHARIEIPNSPPASLRPMTA